MTGLSHEHFADKLGTTYMVAPGDGDVVPLRLRAFEPLNDSGRPGGSFRLEFVGPSARHLPQAIYPFTAEGEAAVDIFIVPIARDQDGFVYEAVFY